MKRLHPKSRYNLCMPRTAAQLLDEIHTLPADDQHWLTEELLRAADEEAFAELQKEFGEPEPGYDEWFRKGVEEALADDSPGIPHELVVKEIGEILNAARERKSLKARA